jgi:hypothetical protein
VRRLQRDYAIRVASAVDLVDVISAEQPGLLAGGASLAALSKWVEAVHSCGGGLGCGWVEGVADGLVWQLRCM